MTQNTQQPVLLSSQSFNNGVKVSFYNISKNMTGDRWIVKVKCDAIYPLTDNDWVVLQEEDADLVAGMKEKYSQGLVLSIVKERIFVDEGEVNEVLGQLLEQFEENVINYMSSDIFPQKLFKQKLEEWRKEYQVKKEMGLLEESEEEVDEPADFSACFADKLRPISP